MRQSILDLSKFLAKNGLPDKERSPELLQQYITVDNFDELRSKISDQEFKDILYAIKVLFKLD